MVQLSTSWGDPLTGEWAPREALFVKLLWPLVTLPLPPSATVVSAEPFLYLTGTLRCLQKEMATYRRWSVSLWRDPDDVSHSRILSPDKTEWRLISATLCGWRRCFVADQLWLMKHIREEEDYRTTFCSDWGQLVLLLFCVDNFISSDNKVCCRFWSDGLLNTLHCI